MNRTEKADLNELGMTESDLEKRRIELANKLGPTQPAPSPVARTGTTGPRKRPGHNIYRVDLTDAQAAALDQLGEKTLFRSGQASEMLRILINRNWDALTGGPLIGVLEFPEGVNK